MIEEKGFPSLIDINIQKGRQIYSPAKGIYMIGLNSSNSIANIFMIARGYLAIFQRMSLSKQLKQIHLDDPKPFIIVFLHHHPFIFPDDRKHIFAFLWEFFAHRLLADFALRRILKNKVNIILFGHDHFHLDFSKTIIAKKFKVEHLLSCTQSTLINPCYDMNYDGTTNTNALRKKGFLGWEIEIANGKVKAPIVLGRDHLDCGSVASPNRETKKCLMVRTQLLIGQY